MEYALPGQQADFAEKLRRAVRRDNRLARLAAALDDPDLTCQHHDQVITHVPIGKQHLAGGNVMLAAVPAQHLKLRRVQDRATPGLGRLRRTPGAPGGGARRRSRSVGAIRAARTLPHRVPATSSQGEPPPTPGRQEPLVPARYALPGRSDCTCPRLVATMHHGRHMGGSILTGLGVRIDYSLFILTRTRTGLGRGLSVEEAVTAAAGAAGRDVLFAAQPYASPCSASSLLGSAPLSGPAIGGLDRRRAPGGCGADSAAVASPRRHSTQREDYNTLDQLSLR